MKKAQIKQKAAIWTMVRVYDDDEVYEDVIGIYNPTVVFV